MAQRIGYQDGIDWFVAFVRKIPGVKYRPVGDRPTSLEQWYGLEKFERTLRILKDDHDAAIVTPPPLPPPIDPDPPAHPWDSGYPPMSYRDAPGGEPSQRFNVRINCTFQNGDYVDRHGNRYDTDGRDKGGRTHRNLMVLKPANEMDGRDADQPYFYNGRWIGPGQADYPAESYER